jgi:regulatory protein RepA
MFSEDLHQVSTPPPPTPPAPQILLTVFPSLTSSAYEEHLVSVSDLHAFLNTPLTNSKSELPLFKAARFSGALTPQGSPRADRFITSRTGIEVDYDRGILGISEAHQLIQNAELTAILYTSPSWTKECPRWRAFFPFGEERIGDHNYLRSWSVKCIDFVGSLLPDKIASESKTLSQPYYFGSVKHNPAQFLISKGRFLDIVVLPPKLESVTPKSEFTKSSSNYMSPEHQQELYEIIHIGSEGVHEALRGLAMMFVNRGQDGPSVKALLETLMRHANWDSPSHGPGNDSSLRWQNRFNEIPRLVDSAVAKKVFSHPSEHENDPELVEELKGQLLSVSSTFTRLELEGGLKPPESVVENYMLGSEAGGLVSQGGTGKTTLAIFESIHIILGLSLYGLEVTKPGKVLFMTAEDRRETVGFRLGRILDQMSLSFEQIDKVISDFICIDLSHDGLRLLTSNKFGNLESSPLADQIIETYQGDNIAYVHIDPVSLVGPGETSGNDGMAELLRISRRIAKALSAAVRLVHHTSKAVAMEGTLSQYSGRGGAAFADNSRFQHQLTRIGNDELRVGTTSYLVPAELGALEEDYQFGRVLALLRHKMSYSELDTRPIFILRHGFGYKHAYGIPQAQRPNPGARSVPTDSSRAAVLSFLDSELLEGRTHTATTLSRLTAGMLSPDLGRMSQRSRTDLVQNMIAEAILEEAAIQPIPAKGRRVYLRKVLLEENDPANLL